RATLLVKTLAGDGEQAVACIDRRLGAVRWVHRESPGRPCSVQDFALTEDVAYVVSDATEAEGLCLRALDVRSGASLWTRTIEAESWIVSVDLLPLDGALLVLIKPRRTAHRLELLEPVNR